MYKKGSAACVGTMAQAKGFLGATKVPEVDAQKAYYPLADLVDKTTNAYIIAGALAHFAMEDYNGDPMQNTYQGNINNKVERKQYILTEAMKFVESVFTFTIPDVDACAPRSNSYICGYCGKQYKRPTALRKHEHNVHSHLDAKYSAEVELEQPTICTDLVFSYTKKVMTLFLLREEHNDSLHMGDGDRIMRVNKYLMLLCKASNCPKYAYGMLEAQAQVNILLPPRLAFNVTWNRVVNNQGRVDTNLPVDLDLEHDNGYFKDEVKTYRGDFTEKTLKRVSRKCLCQ